jgi:hypothetical protein
VKLQAAAQLTEQLIEKYVKGLATLPQETRRWLRSARQTDIDNDRWRDCRTLAWLLAAAPQKKDVGCICGANI